MDKKIKLGLIFLSIAFMSYGANKKTFISNFIPKETKLTPNNKGSILAETDEVVFDLENNTVISENGLNFKQGDAELKVFSLERDKENKRVSSNESVESFYNTSGGKLYLQSKNGMNVSENGEDGEFFNNYGYLEVGRLTGAEKPNDRIFFGGDKIIYKDEKIFINNGWVTTDYNIDKTKNYTDAGYHILFKDILIEQDKQITFKNSDLFVGKNKITPFSFPWFRANIRQNSKVPLFPEWGTNEYYGWNTSVGVLYGDKNSKFVGGFAPKFADRMGFLVGRWENWYKTDNYGTLKLNIDDWLISSKEKKGNFKNIGEEIAFEERDKRYRVGYSYNYSGEYGNAYFNGTTATYNMISKLDDIVDDYAIKNKFGTTEKEGLRPKLTNNASFYSMNSTLLGLGENKDIVLNSNLKLTNDKKIYSLMVYDTLQDLSYGSSVDNDLFSQVSLYKDNKEYKIGGYYDYLYDMDPGSTKNDLESRRENFGFEYLDKKTKIGFTYDEKHGNSFRGLELWERDEKLKSLITHDSMYGTKFSANYSPTTIKEYDFINSKDLRVSLGEYKLNNRYSYNFGFDSYWEEKKLNLNFDPLRRYIDTKNVRNHQYNRFENIVYSNFKEDKGYFNIFDGTTKLTLNIGRTKEEFWDREGIYKDNSYKIYKNNSEFYEVIGRKNEIDLGNFGNIALKGGLRYDRYDEKDETLRSQFELKHLKTLYSNKKNPSRKRDFSLDNEFTLFLQKYAYKGNKSEVTKEERLKNKEDIYQIKDKITSEIGNTQESYTIDYKKGNKNSESLKNSVDIKIDGKNSLTVYHNIDKFTTKNPDNNLILKKSGVILGDEKHKISADLQQINSNIFNVEGVDNSKEKINQQTYSYQYSNGKDRLTFEFGEGKDRNYNYVKNRYDLDVNNQKYAISFLSGGEVENYYRIAYEKYQHREEDAKNLVLDGKKYNRLNSDVISAKYEYRDKRFTEKELKKLAKSEYDKDENQLTTEDIQKVKEIIEKKQRDNVDFKLNSDVYEKFDNMSNYKKNLKVNVALQKNEARYKQTGDYGKSLEKIEGSLFYSQNKLGVGYKVTENNGWNNKNNWDKIDREHEVSLVAKVGKPSTAVNVKAYAEFYEDLKDKKNVSAQESRKASLDRFGIEVGKEFDYYQWSVAVEKKYVLAAKDYEWRTAVQFKLLTFPNQNIFGAGTHTKTNKHTSEKLYLFDGLDVEK